jgi:hypothetical protein
VKFDLDAKHTVKEWKDYFLTIQPDLYGLPEVMANNIHADAWYKYIAIKYKKGLVIVEHDFDRRGLEYLAGVEA